MKQVFKRDIHIAIVVGLIFTIMLSITRFDASCSQIRGSVLRLHVLANSDSDEDQALKLKVRDRLLSEGSDFFNTADNEKQALELAQMNINELQAAAEDEIAKNGYDFPVTVEIGEADFDTRVYENFTLPAGRYEAVRVLIGDAKGENWWCVMFPPVCLPAAGETKELSDVLEEDELKIVENPQDYEIRFKSVELYEKVKSGIIDFFGKR